MNTTRRRSGIGKCSKVVMNVWKLDEGEEMEKEEGGILEKI